MRAGIGYDVHRLVEGRPLILGGVEIPFSMGLSGHSDADVLVHSICDALLGAAGLGDIGIHYPDTEPEFKDIFSIKLLRRSYDMVLEKGFVLQNIDSTIFAEQPKLNPYKDAMRNTIASSLEIDRDRVNIKATTTEGLGFIGKGRGIAAMSVAMLSIAP